ncbi:unnamed protein product [Adineta steineri]|uniref:Uncharacterized protein n=1 Tax=Adineta steineri TaxID=433720 RepID=A0A815ACI1_9BILA|nr:unnamed protein product [Adineta steineri]
MIYSDCPLLELCDCSTKPNTVICNGNSGNNSDNTYFPPLALLPAVEEYTFLNFKQLQANAFENLTFLANHSILIRLINITTINSDAFSTSLIIPTNSTLSIEIGQSTNSSSITLKPNAFDHLKINRLHFTNINNFNGRPIFDTTCFGENLHINQLTIQQSSITGFSNGIKKPAYIKQLHIRECPLFTQLTDKSLPTFLSTTELLEMSTTGLQLINSHTFQAWSLRLKELIIQNNPNFKIFSSHMIDGVLMELHKLDLSNNSITSIDNDYDWFAYSYTKHLILKQLQLDLFLKTNILKTLQSLKIVDFSESFISENNDDLIRAYVPAMPNLVSINVSHTNLTENMIIDLLTRLSTSANQTIEISLLGHTLNDSNFCSYFSIFQKAPNLLHLELDETHECNCVVDLFYQDEHIQMTKNDTLKRPKCLLDTPRRIRCNIQSQLTTSKCSVDKPNPLGPGTGGQNIGDYAFTGVMIGLGVVLLILLGLGTGVLYRVRKNRRLTILDMEEPIENPLAAIIEERLQKKY